MAVGINRTHRGYIWLPTISWTDFCVHYAKTRNEWRIPLCIIPKHTIPNSESNIQCPIQNHIYIYIYIYIFLCALYQKTQPNSESNTNIYVPGLSVGNAHANRLAGELFHSISTKHKVIYDPPTKAFYANYFSACGMFNNAFKRWL